MCSLSFFVVNFDQNISIHSDLSRHSLKSCLFYIQLKYFFDLLNSLLWPPEFVLNPWALRPEPNSVLNPASWTQQLGSVWIQLRAVPWILPETLVQNLSSGRMVLNLGSGQNVNWTHWVQVGSWIQGFGRGSAHLNPPEPKNVASSWTQSRAPYIARFLPEPSLNPAWTQLGSVYNS